ncbi:MAG: NTPase [Candidatus Bathyarchaeia archaeon]
MKNGESKRLILITGPPRTGKTTVLLKTAEKLRAQGYTVGGMTSQELREKDIRVGFEIRDYTSGRTGWLAHIRQPMGPRIGKYRVNVDGLNSIGVTAMLKALEDADIVLIDEIGPMELCSEAFIEAVKEAANSPKPVLATIHYHAQNQLIKQIKSRKDADMIEVTLENRSKLPDLVTNKAIDLNKGNLS